MPLYNIFIIRYFLENAEFLPLSGFRGKNVWTFLVVSFQHKTFNTQNWPNSKQCIDKRNQHFKILNSKYNFPYSQEMSFDLSVKPREYKELLHYNSWHFCLHRNTVVKFYVCWINLLIFKLVVVVSFFFFFFPPPWELLMCSVKTIHTNLGNNCWNQSTLWFPTSASAVHKLLCTCLSP